MVSYFVMVSDARISVDKLQMHSPGLINYRWGGWGGAVIVW